MKKIILLITSIILLSCSSSDNSSSTNAASEFHPPSWIQGVWRDEASFGFKFTSNNVCQLASTNQNCFKEMIDSYNQTNGITTSVDEEIISNDEYKFSYTVSAVTQYFHFVKESNNTIEYVQPNGMNPIYTKQ